MRDEEIERAGNGKVYRVEEGPYHVKGFSAKEKKRIELAARRLELQYGLRHFDFAELASRSQKHDNLSKRGRDH
jgi:hypothetical protein